MVKQTKTSNSSQPTAAPLATVEGSLLANSTNTNYLAFISANAAAARLVGQNSQDNLDPDDPEDPEDPEDPGDPGDPTDPGEENFSIPQLSDIEVISNEVVLDSAGIPSARVVFKVRNSSGVVLKAVNVRVEKK